MTEPSPELQQKQTRITIDLPKDLRPVYSNIAFINHTPAEIVLDFAQILPRTPRGSLMARVIMSPMHAKMLHAALAQNLANYEHQFGEIRLPTPRPNIADNFFRFTDEGGTDDEGKQDG